MPDGNAQNLGDVVKSMSVMSTEVLNTYAEGRRYLQSLHMLIEHSSLTLLT